MRGELALAALVWKHGSGSGSDSGSGRGSGGVVAAVWVCGWVDG